MNRADLNAIERRQRSALLTEREKLWALAQKGYESTGRGFVVVDGRELGRRGDVSVHWRSGTTLLNCRGDAQDWIRRSSESVRAYDPKHEFVIQYWAPSNQVHVYTLRLQRTFGKAEADSESAAG